MINTPLILITSSHVADNEPDTVHSCSDGIVKCEKCNSLLDPQNALCETSSALILHQLTCEKAQVQDVSYRFCAGVYNARNTERLHEKCSGYVRLCRL